MSDTPLDRNVLDDLVRTVALAEIGISWGEYPIADVVALLRQRGPGRFTPRGEAVALLLDILDRAQATPGRATLAIKPERP